MADVPPRKPLTATGNLDSCSDRQKARSEPLGTAARRLAAEGKARGEFGGLPKEGRVEPRPLDPIQDPRSPLFDIRSIPGTSDYDPRCDPQSKVFDEGFVQASRSDEVLARSQKLHDELVAMGWRPDAPTDTSEKPKTPADRLKELTEFLLHLPDRAGETAGDAAHNAGNKYMGVDEDHPKPLTPEQQALKDLPGNDPDRGLKKVPEGLVDHAAEAAKEVGTSVADKGISTVGDVVAPGVGGRVWDAARTADELAHTGEQEESRYINKK